ncbi:hypothetical protein H072_6107 [Dactylellina haptotyla CBS 200.50]|uniref:Peptidase A1 domain-containing protein n=1 Tax=Dactylellina haptotyla (strain CBS 200.50) TaxID=1284197 RepID=S8AAV4_DACHA|nr:hypothetical protein H072_6107 [Dactylellina haptotyla CBS 200.50]
MYKAAVLLTATLMAAREVQSLPATSSSDSYPVPDYCYFKQSKFLPFNNAGTNKNWADAPTLKIKVNNQPLIATMDTGSTGIVIDAKYGFNTTDLEKNCEIGHVFYTSSHWLEEGYWCTTNVDIGGVVTSAMALIRTGEVCCPDFNEATDAHRCQKASKSCICSGTCASKKSGIEIEDNEGEAELAVRQTVGKAYMGVGFARGNPPSHNLFMNITSIDGVPVDSTYRHGYVINSTGVWLGVTKANTAGFNAVKLNLRESAADERDWGEPPCAVQINDGVWRVGTFLADTGIPNAYVRGNTSHTEGDRITIEIPDNSGAFGEAKFLSVPTSKAGTIGTDNLMQPTWVGTRSIAGVNTGRRFYNGYDLFFDGDGGYFGLRKKAT